MSALEEDGFGASGGRQDGGLVRLNDLVEASVDDEDGPLSLVACDRGERVESVARQEAGGEELLGEVAAVAEGRLEDDGGRLVRAIEEGGDRGAADGAPVENDLCWVDIGTLGGPVISLLQHCLHRGFARRARRAAVAGELHQEHTDAAGAGRSEGTRPVVNQFRPAMSEDNQWGRALRRDRRRQEPCLCLLPGGLEPDVFGACRSTLRDRGLCLKDQPAAREENNSKVGKQGQQQDADNADCDGLRGVTHGFSGGGRWIRCGGRRLAHSAREFHYRRPRRDRMSFAPQASARAWRRDHSNMAATRWPARGGQGGR